uniref:Uncharacterized protein n=1 Tax=Anopheles melas TaxID=34690 RepID=A0A182UBE3_9DIPT
MASDALFSSTAESSRRRSTFYVPLTTQTSEEIGSIHEIAETTVSVEKECTQNIQHFSLESTYQPDLSACSFAWSLNDSFNDNLDHAACKSKQENKIKRYGLVLNASVNIDDDETKCHEEQTSRRLQSNTSTPIRLGKSRSRSNILSNLSKDHGIAVENLASRSGIVCDLIRREQSNTMSDNSILTAKDKSKTLPQNLFLVNSMPPKSSLLHHSSSRIGNNSTFDSKKSSSIAGLSSKLPAPAMDYMISPTKSISFIRRTHSTKLSRSNSLLKSLTSRCVDQSGCNTNLLRIPVKELEYARLCRILEKPAQFDHMIRDIFILCKDEKVEENATHRMKRRVVEDQYLAHLLWVKRESQHQDLQISSPKDAIVFKCEVFRVKSDITAVGHAKNVIYGYIACVNLSLQTKTIGDD